MKNILLITDNAYTYSGREKICSYMCGIYSDSYNVDLISLNGQGDLFYEFNGVRNVITLEGKKNKYQECVKLSQKYDSVFVLSMGKLTVYFSFYLLLRKLICRKKKKPVDYIACEHVSYKSMGFLVKILKILFLRIYSNVVVLTESDKNTYKKKGINSLVIENPIFYKNILNKKINKKYLAVGRLDDQKNFIELLNIWNIFIVGKDDYVLNIAGEGPLRSSLEEYIEANNLQNSVHLLGKVNNIDKYYLEADVCLMTSKYEGLPLALLEAKSFSVPCIAYDCATGPAEIIEDHIDGFIVEYGNQAQFIKKMESLRDENLYQKFSISTSETSKKFSPLIIKNKWLSLIR